MRERLRIRQIIDGDEIYILIAESCAQDVAPDSSETIDADLNSHAFPKPPSFLDPYHTSAFASSGSL
jgi:hypothetical protein